MERGAQDSTIYRGWCHWPAEVTRDIITEGRNNISHYLIWSTPTQEAPLLDAQFIADGYVINVLV